MKKPITCYFFSAVMTDCYISQSTKERGKVYFHRYGREKPNFLFPDNIVAIWKIKFKSI